ncbi:MAG: MFS transporter [Alphaproteobacteria bacterium]|nr:MFS transporter [Alphaproteobacteria bacterium]
MKNKYIILLTTIYNSINYCQNIIYGFFSIILASTFFPSENLSLSILGSLSAFSAGFLTNPFGGLIFGYFGDRYGRKSTIILSIALTSLPTFCIGTLPSYEEIGIASSLILIFCRLLQGFSVGGQAYTSVVFVVEHSWQGRENLSCSLLAASSLVGAILGTGVGALCTLEMMPSWAWRIPFVLSGLFGLVSYFIMKNVEETQDHKAVQQSDSLKQRPIVEVIKCHLNNFMCVIGISGATLIPFYIISIFMIGYIFSSNFDFSPAAIMLTTTFFMLIWVVLLPIMGYLSDNVGEIVVMRIASISMFLFAFPLSWIAQVSTSIPLTLLALGLLCAIAAAYVAPSGTLMTKLFPVAVRCSGISVASGIGSALFGGTAPLIGALLFERTGMVSFSALYIMLGSLLGYIGLKKANFSIKQDKISSEYSPFLPSNDLKITLNKQGYMLTNLHEYSQAFVDFSPAAPGPVLDIGAAYGVASIPALQAGAHVIANDMDIRHLKILEQNAPESSLKRLELRAGRIPGEVSFSENSLGAVLASGVLHFLPGDEMIDAIDQIFKWLKPGGKFFFASSTPYANLYHDFMPLYLERKKSGQRWPGIIENTGIYAPNIAHEIPEFVNLVDLDLIESILLNSGFTIEKISFFNISKIANDINSEGNGVLGAIARK